jgi:RND family efflux transporter MFP subunit
VSKKIWMALVAVVLAGCGTQTEKPAEPVRKTVIAPVATLGEAARERKASATGRIEARTRTVVAAQVMGSVRKVGFEVGQSVREGDVLVEIDAAQVIASQAQAEAGRRAEAQMLIETQASIEAARAQLELAQTTHRRMAQLFDRKSLTAQEMDEANARLKQAEANLAMARARQTQVEARIAQAEQGVAVASIQAAYTKIRAPFSGVITEKQVQPGAMALPGAPLFTIERAGGFRAVLDVEERLAGTIRSGQRLLLHVEGQEPREATVSEVVPSLDPASRSLQIKADLPAMAGLRTGAYVSGEWTLGQSEVLMVPVAAVQERGQMQLVYVIEDGVARSRMVSLGTASGGQREVLSGLRAGERVVAQLTEGVTDGVRIEVRP